MLTDAEMAALMEKPLTELTADDIACLPPQTSAWVTQWLYNFKRERFFELYRARSTPEHSARE